MIDLPSRTRSAERNNVEHRVTIREFLMNNQLTRSFEFLASKQLLAIVLYIFRSYSIMRMDSLNQPTPFNLHKIHQYTSLFLINVKFLDSLGERGDFFNTYIISTKLAAKLIYFHILIIFSLMFHAFPFVASCLSFFYAMMMFLPKGYLLVMPKDLQLYRFVHLLYAKPDLNRKLFVAACAIQVINMMCQSISSHLMCWQIHVVQILVILWMNLWPG